MITSLKNLISSSAKLVLVIPRSGKRLMAVIVDICLCILTTWLAFYLRLGEFIPFSYNLGKPIALSIVLALPIFVFNGQYHTIFRHSGWPAIKSVCYAMIFYTIIYMTIVMVFNINGTPRTIGIIQPLLLLLLIVCSRLGVSLWLVGFNQNNLERKKINKILIYGAGVTGQQLATTIMNSPNMQIIGFLDDDTSLSKQILNGVSIFLPDQLHNLKKKHGISVVLLAIPSVPRIRRREIIEFVANHNIAVRTIPDFNDLAEGKIKVSDINDLDIDDLLGREIVKPDEKLLSKIVHSKTIVVTGAGGSIGSEITRQIIKLKPDTLLLIDKNEFNLYDIHSKLESIVDKNKNFPNIKLVPLLGSVNNKKFLRKIFSTWKIDTIYHAAAYKHVPLVEYNVINSLYNNVMGTLSLAEIALEKKIKNFMFISTDKAVRPKNLMGASKRLGEIILQSLFANQNSNEKTIFSMVRFGNVLESSGSVIPKFRQQIREGGPVTLTDLNITRYFMTITEASQLVIQASAMSKGGEVFVLDMGSQVLIYDLAIRMINLSGLTVKDETINPKGDIEIKIIGLRPGEKLYEELLLGNDPQKTKHSKIKKANEDYILWNKLETEINNLRKLLDENKTKASIELMRKLVKEFQPNSKIADLIFNKESN
jgi:FlaA1/EpsC-like NDP-sugar epimerase